MRPVGGGASFWVWQVLGCETTLFIRFEDEDVCVAI